ncbi:hypothetical protein AKJ57_05560 [candidate division MSBL1 archaeon SCGC-AAA259A05]|uniref:Uncharacterized protein n=1 Tax=candidate division MSBL1 archaeon SCGC-AAA259A05 TaxID=1698259 RepID=A0A133U512_9EURY|nr:hypothetical protein AKJ57_05560 [candidate division MSBL1 archaeon SCGC-AAA259A05]
MASSREPVLERNELVEKISSDRSITCLCWFGGTPEPQSPFVYEVSRKVREKAEEGAESSGYVSRQTETSRGHGWRKLPESRSRVEVE